MKLPMIGKVEMTDDELAESLKNYRPVMTVIPRGIEISEDNRLELGRLLGRNIADVDDLMLAVRNVTTLSVKGLEEGDITLEPYLLNRLKSRCHPTEYFPKFVRERVKELLAGYAGC